MSFKNSILGWWSRPNMKHVKLSLQGSPEIVIEVLSPSNTKRMIHEKAVLCLSSGTLQFWVVDPKGKTVTVTPKDGSAVVYHIGDCIPLPIFQSNLSVAEIFS